jgi:hypothetical protein
MSVFAIYKWGYEPMVDEYAKLEKTLSSLDVKVKEAKRVPAQIADYQAKIEELEGKTTDDDTGEIAELRQEIDVPTILAIVEQSASSSEMKLSSIAMDGNAAFIKGGVISGGQQMPSDGIASGNNSFYRLGIALSIESVTYEGLMSFLQSMEDANYYLTTSAAKLRLQADGSYNGAINFYIYSFVSAKK